MIITIQNWTLVFFLQSEIISSLRKLIILYRYKYKYLLYYILVKGENKESSIQFLIEYYSNSINNLLW